jgi:pyruvate/2-oxoglutarate dehydrogenase complex dihydrolipoamide acyltransferase (E2) component
VTAEAAQPPRPLPIRPGPVSGESTFSYIRRLAVANHMRPLHLRRYLKAPGPGGGFRLDWLAVLAGRPVISLQHALADQEPPAGTASRHPPDSRQRKRSKAELFTLIRRDAREHGLSARALADKYGAGKRVVHQALRSPTPAPRKPQPLRGSRIDPFIVVIDDMLQAELQAFPPKRRPAISIYRELVARHGADEVSYQMVRAYVGRRRTVIRRQSLSPAHQAVSDHDLDRLRDLLNDGHDIEDDSGDGWSLLRRAIHAEADRHAGTGEPLHADMTALLLARGAKPREDSAGTAAEAELLGHWLAAEIVSAWPGGPN